MNIILMDWREWLLSAIVLADGVYLFVEYQENGTTPQNSNLKPYSGVKWSLMHF